MRICKRRLLNALVLGLALLCGGARAQQPDAYVEMVVDFGANCVARSAKQLLVVNRHPDKAIKIKLFRYYGEVRQPGRSAYVLQPGAEPTALGCDRIDGRAQRWEIVKAEFVDAGE